MQFAFIPNIKYGGCCNALTLIRVWTIKALNEGAVYVSWLAIDFKKAFDSVSHKKVLETLMNSHAEEEQEFFSLAGKEKLRKTFFEFAI